MDAKTRDLALLIALSLFCAGVAWISDYLVLGSVFFCARCSRRSRHSLGAVTLDMDQLILKRASASRLSGEWSEDDYDVLNEGTVVGRIMKAAAAPAGQPWLWTLAYGHHEDRTPIYGYEATREAAMAAFAKELAAGIGSLCLGTPKTGPHIAPASQPSGASATR